ncbi:30S ribosomal protein S2 [Candidatus Gottesmanbacteria bacterium RBG_16_52_11]|uniref:Small ribosomal subunit protein uS2 n=1 Tax=Candidatus Gottesmanbacteria bacterium RBG_16_52_11 TaxID=1798374 RepID=A0A1F5YP30_9BACT|nr:MAG: 30S ribosomal protein S2 [Candidatus Gottesmanbacteria bacterium RBG_16_52_11]
MQEITLQQLLEAGCHFGHKSERWHPRASEFIYTEKDGIHIIDLAKTREGLLRAAAFVTELVATGSEIIAVATKRQAKDIVKEAAESAGMPYFTERWIGGFLTNWDEIKKNIEKANRMITEQENDAWKIFPKHEQMQLKRELRKLINYYGGVLKLTRPPQALFVVDVRKEIAAVREAVRVGLPVVAIVDTNSDPRGIGYPIPANDDAVGSIMLLTRILTQAYSAGRQMREKGAEKAKTADQKQPEDSGAAREEKTPAGQDVKKSEKSGPAAGKLQTEPKKKRGRPKKTAVNAAADN